TRIVPFAFGSKPSKGLGEAGAVAVAVAVGVGEAVAVAVGVAEAVAVAVGVGFPLANTEIGKLVPVMERSAASEAVTVWDPGVPRNTVKVPVPLVSVLSGGRWVPFTPWSVLVKCTVLV